MIRDPFYNDILKALKDSVDPNLFEQCVGDILRSELCTLVPVPGGQDDGMDGAIADGEGVPFPLVATTSKQVIANLKRNLEAYRERGDNRSKAVLACTDSLTRRRRKNNQDAAEALGFTLIQQYDCHALADRLYDNPHWCKALLGLTGEPPALSAMPPSGRVQLDAPLIGRQKDIEWLEKTTGDRLVVGQPGSGKTYLLRQLVSAGEALFLNSSDMKAIAADLRKSKPRIVILDDAHTKRKTLRNLLHMRDEFRLSFSLCATCWPNYEQDVTADLHIGSGSVRGLELLSRDEIAEIIKHFGPHWSNDLIHELVNQAEGRPGLASTLAWLCQKGDVVKAYTGEALTAEVLRQFSRLVGETASAIIATFSLGGDSGLALAQVSKALQISQIKVRDAVTKLAAGGVISERSVNLLVVRPPPLRDVLVRDVFFGGAASLNIETVLNQIPNPDDCIGVLIGAKARGAKIPKSFLLGLLERVSTSESDLYFSSRIDEFWKKYAWVDSESATDVLERCSERVTDFARPLLAHIPDRVIPLLLESADGDNRPLHSHPSHPHRLIQDWIKDVPAGNGETILRRRILLKAIENWCIAEKTFAPALAALPYVFCPDFEHHQSNPGSGMTFTWSTGTLTINELKEITSFWPRTLALLNDKSFENWSPIKELIHSWAYPQRALASHAETMQTFASQILADIEPLIQKSTAARQWANGIAEHLHLGLKFEHDEEYDTLFPRPDYAEQWQISEKRKKDALCSLANIWSTQEPTGVIRRLNEHLKEAARLSGSANIWGPTLLAKRLSELVECPLAWASTLIDECTNAELMEPFLRAAVKKAVPAWETVVRRCLALPNLKASAIEVVMTESDPPTDLLDMAFATLSGYAWLIENLCIHYTISDDIAARFLGHSNEIAFAAAKGLWREGKQSAIRPALWDAWKAVIIKMDDDPHHFLARVFAVHSELGFEWICERVKSDSRILSRDEISKSIASRLSDAQKEHVLGLISNRYPQKLLVSLLVRGNVAVYKKLLCNSKLASLHLLPLNGPVDDGWIALTKTALDAGKKPSEIAKHFYPIGYGYSGNESAYWQGWINNIQVLLKESDSRIREIGEIVLESASANRARALKEERAEAIYGRD